MTARIIGGLAVILGCGGIGFYYSLKDGMRVGELQELKKALLILASEIEYMRSPLNIACANIAKRTTLATSKLFESFANYLDTNNGETAYQAWCQAIASIKNTTLLTQEDLQVVDSFGKTLGYLDKHMQQNAISHAINYMDEKTTALQLQSHKNKRMYRSLGVICGMLITIVLW